MCLLRFVFELFCKLIQNSLLFKEPRKRKVKLKFLNSLIMYCSLITSFKICVYTRSNLKLANLVLLPHFIIQFPRGHGNFGLCFHQDSIPNVRTRTDRIIAKFPSLTLIFRVAGEQLDLITGMGPEESLETANTCSPLPSHK